MEASSYSKARCVVWHPRGRPPRPELAAALDRPGLRFVRCESALQAFAHLTTRQGPWALAPHELGVLILVEPDRLEGLVGVIDVVDRYNPAAAVWQFDPASEPRLRSVAPADLSHWRTQHVQPAESDVRPALQEPVREERPPAASARPSAPGLRLAGEGPIPPEYRPPDASAPPHPHPDVKPAPRTEPAPRAGQDQGAGPAARAPEPSEGPQPIVPLLSDEELAMLLSGDADQKR